MVASTEAPDSTDIVALSPAASLDFERTEQPIVLRLTNDSSQRAGFKVKTTVPHDYSVKPNSGFLDPGQSEEIQITLQKYFDTSKRHQFLVQATYVPGFVDDDQFWERTTLFDNPVQQTRIRVDLPKTGGEFLRGAARLDYLEQELRTADAMNQQIRQQLFRLKKELNQSSSRNSSAQLKKKIWDFLHKTRWFTGFIFIFLTVYTAVLCYRQPAVAGQPSTEASLD